jgi:hypothetical protein
MMFPEMLEHKNQALGYMAQGLTRIWYILVAHLVLLDCLFELAMPR